MSRSTGIYPTACRDLKPRHWSKVVMLYHRRTAACVYPYPPTGCQLSEIRLVEESQSMIDASKIMLESLMNSGQVRVGFGSSLMEEAKAAARGTVESKRSHDGYSSVWSFNHDCIERTCCLLAVCLVLTRHPCTPEDVRLSVFFFAVVFFIFFYRRKRVNAKYLIDEQPCFLFVLHCESSFKRETKSRHCVGATVATCHPFGERLERREKLWNMIIAVRRDIFCHAAEYVEALRNTYVSVVYWAKLCCHRYLSHMRGRLISGTNVGSCSLWKRLRPRREGYIRPRRTIGGTLYFECQNTDSFSHL